MKLLPASFRGVPFEVEETDDTLGARNIIHEFPGKKEIFAEPNGVEAKRFTIEAHIIGADYASRLEKLEKALEEEKPGKLVHPYRGEKLVALVEPARIRQSTREGGMARISLTFIEAGTVTAPKIRVDTGSLVKAKVALTLSQMDAASLDVSGPNFLQDAAAAILAGPQGLTDKLESVRAQIAAAFGLIDDVSGAIDDFSAAVNGLLRTPAELALKLHNLVNSVMTAIGSAGNELNRGDKQRNVARVESTLTYTSALGSFGSTLDPVIGDTASRNKQRANQNALADLIDVSGLANGVQALADLPLDNTDQADDVLDRVDAIHEAIEDRGTLSDDAAQSLRDLRAAFHEHMRQQTIDLTELGHFTPPLTQPALLIAWQLYGDAARDEEIIERNAIEHPGFIPGGVQLAVSNV